MIDARIHVDGREMLEHALEHCQDRYLEATLQAYSMSFAESMFWWGGAEDIARVLREEW